MIAAANQLNQKNPAVLFSLGLGAVMLSLFLPYVPSWPTFIHMWRAELAASVFLLTALLAYRHRLTSLTFSPSSNELRFVIAPILALIIWSGLSVAWAPSWKSALHHTLVWSEYLIFYLIVRHLLHQARNYRTVTISLMAVFAIVSIPAIVEYCAFLTFGGGSVLGLRYSRYGEQVNTLLPLAAVGVLFLKGRHFAVGLTGLALMWLLIFVSFSRINFLLFICGMSAVTAMVFIVRRLHKYRLKTIVVITVIIAAPIPLHVFSLLSTDPNIPMVKRLSDEKTIGSSNNFRKLMASVSFEMIAAHPITGVGADNFGFEFNKYRAAYVAKTPLDPNLAEAENQISERTHNEYLQIFAELGIVGILIFLWVLSGIAYMAFRAFRLRRTVSSFALASLIGLAMFLASSLVSSFSFRLIQNGFVFFFVLAVAAKYLFKAREVESDIVVQARHLKFYYVTGILACSLLICYCSVRVVSVIITTQANHATDVKEAISMYEFAARLDDENPDVRNFHGMRLFHEGQYAAAVPLLDEAIRIGRAPSPSFSYLASAQALAGDGHGAEQTFAMARKLYPQSPFVLTRYAALLKENGKAKESATQLELARKVNKAAANTWWTLMNEGPRVASDRAFQNNDHAAVMDLSPSDSLYAYIAERDVRYPKERIKLPF